jgi:hypothetical protein
MNDTFLTRSEFSEKIKVSLSTVSRGVKNNQWPFNAYVRIGSQLRYPESLLKEIEDKAKAKQKAKEAPHD